MKKIVLGMLLASSSLTVMAVENELSSDWFGGINYINLSADDESDDFSLGGVVGSLGYKFKSGGDFYLIPEVRVGVGASDGSYSIGEVNVDVKLDRFLALSLRGQFELDNGVYLFAAPTYMNTELTITAKVRGQKFEETGSTSEFGVGGGAGYNFTKTVSAEVTYELFDDVDVVGLGLNFHF
ncbi:MAG: opacity protein-like surface antigen [Paracoccaceae bacterium]|jgi:opacity protein-like surface antigen